MSDPSPKNNGQELPPLSPELLKLCGVVKKKRKPGLLSLVDSSVEVWLAFRCDGRFLVSFDGKEAPKPQQKPNNVIFINEITELVDEHTGKKNHFLLKVRNQEELHFKVDEMDAKTKWVNALKELIARYPLGSCDNIECRGVEIPYLDNRKHSLDKLDIKFVDLLMVEQEAPVRNAAQAQEDFTKILRAKGLGVALGAMNLSMQKRHILMGRLKVNSGQVVGHEELKDSNLITSSQMDTIELGPDDPLANIMSPVVKVGNQQVLQKNILKWQEHFCILASKKSLIPDDECTDMLSEIDLPNNIEPDALYIYEIKGDQDDSNYVRKISGVQIKFAELISSPSFQGNYQLVIEQKSEAIFLGTQFADEMFVWLSALRKIKKTKEETMRTQTKDLKRNIDGLIRLYRSKELGPIQEQTLKEFVFDDADPLNSMKTSQQWLIDVERKLTPDPRLFAGIETLLLRDPQRVHEGVPLRVDQEGGELLEQ